MDTRCESVLRASQPRVSTRSPSRAPISDSPSRAALAVLELVWSLLRSAAGYTWWHLSRCHRPWLVNTRQTGDSDSVVVDFESSPPPRESAISLRLAGGVSADGCGTHVLWEERTSLYRKHHVHRLCTLSFTLESKDRIVPSALTIRIVEHAGIQMLARGLLFSGRTTKSQ
ncbi:hypothetical protein PYCCODRAFT_209243 [Trametes coccinea BRFM310]|uniref:Uncharacterized protein n=1 Tax=Trametes coccinea (strain BRFM310) TaxID=1353009 RepID=A0A1Y2I4Y7_TRAC3|nr:hypothetical protein PYCCODRAFT_209243 [Trametes coccinea BRFM310]